MSMQTTKTPKNRVSPTLAKYYREKAGFKTVKAAADATGISIQYLSEIECGSKTGSLNAALAMSDAYGCKVEDLTEKILSEM